MTDENDHETDPTDRIEVNPRQRRPQRAMRGVDAELLWHTSAQARRHTGRRVTDREVVNRALLLYYTLENADELLAETGLEGTVASTKRET